MSFWPFTTPPEPTLEEPAPRPEPSRPTPMIREELTAQDIFVGVRSDGQIQISVTPSHGMGSTWTFSKATGEFIVSALNLVIKAVPDKPIERPAPPQTGTSQDKEHGSDGG